MEREKRDASLYVSVTERGVVRERERYRETVSEIEVEI